VDKKGTNERIGKQEVVAIKRMPTQGPRLKVCWGEAALRSTSGQGSVHSGQFIATLPRPPLCCVAPAGRTSSAFLLKRIFRGSRVAGGNAAKLESVHLRTSQTAAAPQGMKIEDIDIWELNEAFAVQVVYCFHHLGIDRKKLKVKAGRCHRNPSA